MPRKNRVTEWVGGLRACPSELGAPSDSILLWLGPGGDALFWRVGTAEDLKSGCPDDLLDILDSESATLHKLRPPSRFRVSDELTRGLAEALAERAVVTQVVGAATPEIDVYIETMRGVVHNANARLQAGELESTNLRQGLSVKHLQAMFRSAAAVYQTRLWQKVGLAYEDASFLVDIESDDPAVVRRDAVVDADEDDDVTIFVRNTVEEHERFQSIGEELLQNSRNGTEFRREDYDFPACLALRFAPALSAPAAILKEAKTLALPIANGKGFPQWARQPQPDEEEPIAYAEAIVLGAVTAALNDFAANRPEGFSLRPQEHRYLVPELPGNIRVTLRWPVGLALLADPFDVREMQRRKNGTLHPRWHHAWSLVLSEKFYQTGYPRVGGPWIYVAQIFGFAECDQAITTIEPADFEDVIFRMFPEKLVCFVPEAGDIVRELRAFLTYLRDTLQVRHADALLKVLDEHAEQRLATALGNIDLFGISKMKKMLATVRERERRPRSSRAETTDAKTTDDPPTATATRIRSTERCD